MSDKITIRPGHLVTLSTKIIGGRTYEREDLSDERTESGAEVEEWRTVKVTTDPEEYERAVQVRSRVRSLFKSAAVQTPFGLICPTEDIAALDAAQEQAAVLVREFNDTASTCEVHFTTLRGEIAESTREAIRAIREETAELLRSLDDASRAGEVRTIREIATRATQMGKLLAEESAGRDSLTQAVNAARRVARDIVRRVEKSGEEMAEVLEQANLSPISQARFLFMEHGEPDGDGDADRRPHIILQGTATTVEMEDEGQDGEPAGDDLPMLGLPEPELTEADPLPEEDQEPEPAPDFDASRFSNLFDED